VTVDYAALRSSLARAEAELVECVGGPAASEADLAFRVGRLRRYRRVDIKARLERVRREIAFRRGVGVR
jgi:hypothetical protein